MKFKITLDEKFILNILERIKKNLNSNGWEGVYTYLKEKYNLKGTLSSFYIWKKRNSFPPKWLFAISFEGKAEINDFFLLTPQEEKEEIDNNYYYNYKQKEKEMVHSSC